MVDQKILEIKQDVNHLRNRILGFSTRGLPLANDLLPSPLAVNIEAYRTARHNNSVDPVPGPSTSNKGKRASKPSRKKRKRPSIDLSDEDESCHDDEDLNSSAKVKVLKLNCPEGCQGLVLQTKKQYHDHLNKQHGLQYKCLHRGCAQRFRYQ